MENGAFFVPWFDKDGYIEGINGKKLLVLGASFYCNQDGKRNERCEYYVDCTINQNTRKYDLCCPYNNGRPLHDLPTNDLCEDAPAHKNFFDLFKEFLGDKELNFDDFWKRAAFTNYVQHELGNRTDTQASDCKEEYLVMFEDVLSKLPQIPDVVITWGSIIDKELKKKKKSDKYPNFENTCNKNDCYKFLWKNYAGKDITFLCFYHPCCKKWFRNKKEWCYMLDLLKKEFSSSI